MELQCDDHRNTSTVGKHTHNLVMCEYSIVIVQSICPNYLLDWQNTHPIPQSRSKQACQSLFCIGLQSSHAKRKRSLPRGASNLSSESAESRAQSLPKPLAGKDRGPIWRLNLIRSSRASRRLAARFASSCVVSLKLSIR